MSEQAMSGLERLKRLVVVLEEVRDDPKRNREFDIGAWAEETKSCGTHYCACGWGTLDPILAAEGLGLVRSTRKANEFRLSYGGLFDFDAAGSFFDLTYSTALDLFSPDAYGDEDDEIRDPSIQEVIDRINLVVAKIAST